MVPHAPQTDDPSHRDNQASTRPPIPALLSNPPDRRTPKALPMPGQHKPRPSF